MTRRGTVGIHVGRHHAHAVLMIGGEIRWRGQAPAGDSVVDAVRALIAESSTGERRLRVRVVIVVSADLAQVRRLTGLPATATPDAATRIARLHAERFFRVASEDRLATSAALRLGDGELWMAALPESLARQLERAVSAAHAQLVAIAPSVAFIRPEDEIDTSGYRDGEQLLHVRFETSRLHSIRIRRAEALHDVAADGGAREWAIAARAATMQRPAFSIQRVTQDEPSIRSRAAALVALTLATALALGAPALLAARDLVISSRLAAADSTSVVRARDMLASIRRREARMVAIGRFFEHAPSMTRRLAALTNAAEDPTQLVSVALDSTGGTIVAITDDPEALLAALDSLDVVAAARIAGAVIPERQPTTAPVIGMVPPTAPMPPGISPPPPVTASTDSEASPLVRVTVALVWRATLAAPRQPSLIAKRTDADR